MLHRLASLLMPFSVIAQELTLLRRLYEADLAARTPPVFLMTETPGDDTEVSYAGEKPKTMMDKMRDAWNEIPEDDTY